MKPMKKSQQSGSESQKLTDSFDRAARTYLAHAGVQTTLAEWLAQWLPPQRCGRALEIGAGPGIFTRLLLPWDGALTASDLSPEMCAIGRAMLPQVTWQTMAAEAPVRGPWDWIFSSSMLQWASDPAATFSAWRGRLSSHGRVLGAMFVAESLPEWDALSGLQSPLTWRTPDEWRSFLGKAGLRVVRDQSEKRSFIHSSAQAFLRSLHGVGAAPGQRHPPGRLRKLLQDYESRHGTARGVTATWTFYRFEASNAGP